MSDIPPPYYPMPSDEEARRRGAPSLLVSLSLLGLDIPPPYYPTPSDEELRRRGTHSLLASLFLLGLMSLMYVAAASFMTGNPSMGYLLIIAIVAVLLVTGYVVHREKLCALRSFGKGHREGKTSTGRLLEHERKASQSFKGAACSVSRRSLSTLSDRCEHDSVELVP
jgi:hypothetical protein